MLTEKTIFFSLIAQLVKLVYLLFILRSASIHSARPSIRINQSLRKWIWIDGLRACWSCLRYLSGSADPKRSL